MQKPKINKHGSFGKNSGYMRAFFRNTSHDYTVKGLQKKNGDYISKNFGKSHSINRRTDAKTGKNEYKDSEGKTYKVRWDAPYSNYNTYKQSFIYSGKNYSGQSWRGKHS